MRAEILPTMWPRYRNSGYERMFHYRLMTVIRRRMLFAASRHSLTPAGIENMYPAAIDEKHRAWIMEQMFTPCGPQDAVDQLRGLSSSSMPTSWTFSCSRIWASVASRTLGLLFQAFCRTLTTTSWVIMTHMWKTSTGPWMTTGTQSLSHLNSLKVMCRSFCFLQTERLSSTSGLEQQDLWSKSQEETPEA